MSFIFPDVAKVIAANKLLNQALILKLFSNNVTPDNTITISGLTEVAGGGYASFPLVFATWVVSSSGLATYPIHRFLFTGVTNAPGTIYGYYIVDATGEIFMAERFVETIVPFVPKANSIIDITPNVQVTQ